MKNSTRSDSHIHPLWHANEKLSFTQKQYANRSVLRNRSSRDLTYFLLRDWASSSVIWPPNSTLLTPSDGWDRIHQSIKKLKLHSNWRNDAAMSITIVSTWWERGAETGGCEESEEGASGHVRRSEVDTCDFLTGVAIWVLLTESVNYWESFRFCLLSSARVFWEMEEKELLFFEDIFLRIIFSNFLRR